jgi:hypothetical protein
MRGLFDSLWGSVPAEFQSLFRLDESVKKLSMATRRFVFLLATKPVAVGTVSMERVSLRRMTPFYGNNFYVFFGEIRERDGRVVRLWTLYLKPVFQGFRDGFARLLPLVDVYCGLCGIGPRPSTMVVSTPWRCGVWGFGDFRVVT